MQQSDAKQFDEIMDREAAAKFLGGTKSLSPRTLAVWDCTKEYDLQPFKIGKYVHYHRSVLEKVRAQRMAKNA